MLDRWRDEDRPHLAAGGDQDGRIVSYRGAPKGRDGFNYSIPGVMSFAPLYIQAVAMVPLSAEQANAICDARNAKS